MNKNIKTSNKLVNEASPYLLQHSHNPVDWYPWGDDAFKKAKDENKPIFLSIGYSTCHWCHVMEKESFEDEEIAGLLNDAFICIKVDREERPDIDNIYMTVCQITTGSGGWPLTIIMTPDKRPFFAGTYFPKHSMYGRVGMIDLVPKIKELWQTKYTDLITSADQITEILSKITKKLSKGDVKQEVLNKAYRELSSKFDDKYGGFGNAPKFPSAQNFLFLLRHFKRTKNKEALDIVEKTLKCMRKGGIYDHIGFGFHRYSTDKEWLVPHFEKMLYDQAMLSMAYIETYQITKNEFYKNVAKEIFEYVLRDMTSSSGGFYSAEDADSEGVEGKFYVWRIDEVKKVLNTDAEIFIKTFNAKEDGNYLEEATKKRQGTNILHLKDETEESLSEDSIESCRKKLFNERKKRTHPHKDDKILTDWNGLMIASLSKGGAVFNDKRYINAAIKAVDFIFNELYKGRTLQHSYRNGRVNVAGNLDDYAFLIWGLLELYEATFDVSYLEKVIDLSEYLIENFWDEDEGGFYFTSLNSELVIVRKKEFYDGAIPSGNSVQLLNLLRLAHITSNKDYFNYANKLVNAFGGEIEQFPQAYTQMLSALDFLFGKTFEIVVCSKDENDDVISDLRLGFYPNKVILGINPDNDLSRISKIIPNIKYYALKNEKTTIYLCENYSCKEPTNDVEEVLEQL